MGAHYFPRVLVKPHKRCINVVLLFRRYFYSSDENSFRFVFVMGMYVICYIFNFVSRNHGILFLFDSPKVDLSIRFVRNMQINPVHPKMATRKFTPMNNNESRGIFPCTLCCNRRVLCIARQATEKKPTLQAWFEHIIKSFSSFGKQNYYFSYPVLPHSRTRNLTWHSPEDHFHVYRCEILPTNDQRLQVLPFHASQ